MKILIVSIIIFSSVLSPNSRKEEGGLQQRAHDILVKKCNVCHQIKNPKKVFTKENMVDLAPKIYRQVFVWKRMPKGNRITLTDEEKRTLNNWIKSINHIK